MISVWSIIFIVNFIVVSVRYIHTLINGPHLCYIQIRINEYICNTKGLKKIKQDTLSQGWEDP